MASDNPSISELGAVYPRVSSLAQDIRFEARRPAQPPAAVVIPISTPRDLKPKATDKYTPAFANRNPRMKTKHTKVAT